MTRHMSDAFAAPDGPDATFATGQGALGAVDEDAGKTKTKRPITWDDLKYIPAEDFEAGRVAVTGLGGGEVTVTGADLENPTRYLMVAPSHSILFKGTFDALGLGLVREEHPHGLIPEEPWKHLVLGNGRHAVLGDVGSKYPWLVSFEGYYEWWKSSDVQRHADEHGFEVLVSVARVEEGRLAGIREAWDELKQLGPGGCGFCEDAAEHLAVAFSAALKEADR